jgi:hypothetical protein
VGADLVELRRFWVRRVELVGLEPTTSAMPWQRSGQLSYSPSEFVLGREVYPGPLAVPGTGNTKK